MNRAAREEYAERCAFMREALALARRGLYSTMPNPRVGCVLVRDGAIVGRGWHRYSGEPHAEIHALREAGERARGAAAYITLEPCNHRGRTSPCCEALVRAGVVQVHAAMQDPNPQVAGCGFDALREAGVQVETGLLEDEACSLNPGFVLRMREQRPRVLCKLAMSLDGRIAMASGESRWITGPAARSEVQQLRASSCAILTGIGTVLADNPSLTLRSAELPPGDEERTPRRGMPLRVVADSQLRLPVDAVLLQGEGQTLAACASAPAAHHEALAQAGAGILQLPGEGGRVDLGALLHHLAVERQCNEVLLEAGGVLVGAMAARGLIDEYRVYLAPCFLGSAARAPLELSLQTLSQALRLEILELRPLGEDWRIAARPVGGAP